MFVSRTSIVLSPVRATRRRPVLALLIGLCFLGLVGLAGWAYWSGRHLREAQRALQLDLLPRASTAINSHLVQFPNDAEAHLLAARIERLLGKPIPAQKHLEEYKRIEGSTDRFQLEWLLLRAMSGDQDNRDVESGLKYCLDKKDPHSPLIVEALVYLCLKEFRFALAKYYAEEWLRKEPDNVRALHWRAIIETNRHFLDDASGDYERVLELSPEHFDARLNLAKILLQEKSIPQAVKHLHILEMKYPDHPEVIYSLALCRAFQGQPEEATKLLDRLLAQNPENARALHQRGKLAFDLAEQERYFRKAIKIDPSLLEARFSLFSCLGKQPKRREEAQAEHKKYDEMLAELKGFEKTIAALEKSPTNPDLLAEVGRVLLVQNPVSGQEFLYKALQFSPQHQKSHEILANYFKKVNQPEKEAWHREKIITAPK